MLTAEDAAIRQRIAEGAAARIREFGLVGTTLDDIAAATSTSERQLFRYFPDGREALLLAVAAHDQVLVAREPHLSKPATWEHRRAWRAAVVERYRGHGVHCTLGALLTSGGGRALALPPSPRACSSAGKSSWEPGRAGCG
jgi:AcrR family transcriptional regulator